MDYSVINERTPLLGPVGPNGPNLLRSDATSDDVESPNLTEYREPKRWSWFVWFLLKILGLYNYRRIVTRRRCHLCRLAVHKRQQRQNAKWASGYSFYPGAVEEDSEDDDGEDPRKGHASCPVDVNMNAVSAKDGLGTLPGDGNCVVCRGEWLDARGWYQPYSETDIGVRAWNHPGSTLLSIIWPLTLIGLVVYEFDRYLGGYLGQAEHVLYLIRYSTFLLFNLSSPFFILVANVHNMELDHCGTGRCRGFSWYEALGVRYIVKRLQHLELGERGLPYKVYLALCLLWPCLNGAYRAVICYVPNDYVHLGIPVAAGLVNMIVWGAFCYLILLMRLSFQRQLRLELAFLWRHAGALDVCRRRLAVYAKELGSMCRLVSFWIIFVLAVSTWAFSSQISWEYLVIRENVTVTNTHLNEQNIDIMIWSENTMFLVLPLMAVGGMDLNGVWTRFRRAVREMRGEAQESFWDKILALCEAQSPVYQVRMETLVLSALGLYLGLHFGYQSVEYWNETLHTATVLPHAKAEVFSPF